MSAWNTATLSDVLIDARPGFACGDDSPDGVFQFRMNNITTGGQLDYSKKRRVPRATRNLDTFRLEPGDVLFNATNSPELVGKSAYFPGHDEIAVFSNHFLRLRPRADVVEGRFLARWLVLQFQRRIFQGMCRQWVNQAAVGRDALLSLRIPLPPLPEQRRIAEMLDRAEALRAKRRAALAQLDTLTHSIFFDLFGDPFARRDGTAALGDIADIAMGQSPPGSSYNARGMGTPLLNGPTEFGERYPIQVQWTTSPTRLCEVGDILFCVRGATAGRLNRADKTYCLGRGLAAIRPRVGASANADFLFAVLDRYYSYFQEKGVGSTFINISRDELENLPIPRPHQDRAAALARRVAAVEGMRTTHRASLAKLDALFASLQHRAFRGQL